jgi:ketosteroid isomerase-like protein
MSYNREVVEQLQHALESGDIDKMSRAIAEVTGDDFVQEWPQSGERIVGSDAAIRFNAMYERATRTRPKHEIARLVGEGDHYVLEGTIDYGDGTPVSYVGIAELRDGKLVKLTDYFANPFAAPAWRADIVERMEPVRA